MSITPIKAIRFKGGITPKGRRRLSASRSYVQSRKLRFKLPSAEPENIVLEGGAVLNRLESKVYRTLQGLKIDFVPMQVIGRANELGGGITDFTLPDYGIALEVQGEAFHADAQKEFERMLNRELAGLRRVPLFPHEIDGGDLGRVILQKIGGRR